MRNPGRRRHHHLPHVGRKHFSPRTTRGGAICRRFASQPRVILPKFFAERRGVAVGVANGPGQITTTSRPTDGP